MKQRISIRRILSFMLIAALVFGLFPSAGMTAKAEEIEIVDESVEENVEENVEEYVEENIDITPDGDVTTYNLWVGGNQVTSENCNDVLGNGSKQVVYDPQNYTLTLNGYNNNGDYYEIPSFYSGIYNIIDGLKIELKGNNVISNKGDKGTSDKAGYGIVSERNLTIQGTGSLTVSTNDSKYANGIYLNSSGKTLTLAGGTLTVSGKRRAIFVYSGDLIVAGGSISASGSEEGINIGRYLTILGGEIDAEGTAEEKSYGTYVKKGYVNIIDGKISTKGSKSGLYIDEGDLSVAAGTLDANGKKEGIYVKNGDISISGGDVKAIGNESGIFIGNDLEERTIIFSGGKTEIEGYSGISGYPTGVVEITKGVDEVDKVLIYASAYTIKGVLLKNSIAGTMWTNALGTEGKTKLEPTTTAIAVDSKWKRLLFPVDHEHSFTYSATDNVITATCSADDCDLTDSKVSVTLVKPTITKYGESGENATLSGADDFKAATEIEVKASDIKYYSGTTELTKAPTEPGDYTAKISITKDSKTVTAVVDYTIAKAQSTVKTAPTATAITYGQTLADSTLSGGAAEVTLGSETKEVKGTFAWKEPTTKPAVADSQKTEYEVIFTPEDATLYDTASCKAMITVNKADAPSFDDLSDENKPSLVAEEDRTYSGSDIVLLNAPAKMPALYDEIYYSLDGENWSKDIPKGKDAGEYTVKVKYVNSDGDCADIIGEITTNILKKTYNDDSEIPAEYKPSAKTELIYNEEEQELINAPEKTLEGFTIQYSLDGGDYSADIPKATEVGEYTVSVKYVPVDTKNYSEFYGVDIAVTIASRDVYSYLIYADVAAEGTTDGVINLSSYLYGLNRIKSIIVEGDLKDKLVIGNIDDDYYLHYTLAKSEKNKKATVTVVAEDIYFAEIRVYIYMTAKENIISKDLVIEGVQDMIYTGKELKQSWIRVYSNGILLTQDKDYTVSYKNNKNAGTATLTVTGKNNYAGKQTDTFTIYPVDISEEDFYAEDFYLLESKNDQKKKPTLKWNDKTVSSNGNYTIGYYEAGTTATTENPKATTNFKKSYVILISGKGNYTGKRAVNVTISPKESVTLISKLKVATEKSSYTLLTDKNSEGAVEPVVTVSKGTTKYVKGADYDVTYLYNDKVGTAYAVVTGKGKLYGSKKLKFTIKGISIKEVQVSGVKNLTYDPYQYYMRQDGCSLKYGKKDLVLYEDYILNYKNNTKAGKATLIIKGVGDFTGTRNISFTIAKAEIKASEVVVSPDAEYTKGGTRAYVEVTKNNVWLSEGRDYKLTFSKNTAVTEKATAVVTVKGIGNYSGTVTKNFKISKSDVVDQSFKIIMTAPDKKDNGSASTKVSAMLSAPKLVDGITEKALAAKTDYTVAGYAIADASGENFKDITEADKAKKFGSYLKEVFGDKYDYANNGVVIKVTAKLTGGYNGTYSTTYRVSFLSISSAKFTIADQKYTGKVIEFDPTSKTFANDFKVYFKKGSDLKYGTDYIIVPDSYKNNIKKGTATVKIRGLGKYSGEKTLRFKIKAKTL